MHRQKRKYPNTEIDEKPNQKFKSLKAKKPIYKEYCKYRKLVRLFLVILSDIANLEMEWCEANYWSDEITTHSFHDAKQLPRNFDKFKEYYNQPHFSPLQLRVRDLIELQVRDAIKVSENIKEITINSQAFIDILKEHLESLKIENPEKFAFYDSIGASSIDTFKQEVKDFYQAKNINPTLENAYFESLYGMILRVPNAQPVLLEIFPKVLVNIIQDYIGIAAHNILSLSNTTKKAIRSDAIAINTTLPKEQAQVVVDFINFRYQDSWLKNQAFLDTDKGRDRDHLPSTELIIYPSILKDLAPHKDKENRAFYRQNLTHHYAEQIDKSYHAIASLQPKSQHLAKLHHLKNEIIKDIFSKKNIDSVRASLDETFDDTCKSTGMFNSIWSWFKPTYDQTETKPILASYKKLFSELSILAEHQEQEKSLVGSVTNKK